jgi:predicted nucleic acid-binding protein
LRARYLIDKSALARMPLLPVRNRLAPIIEAGEAATCSIIDLEVLYSARNADDHETIRQRRSLAYHSVPITETILQRASTSKPSWPDTAAIACPSPISSLQRPPKLPA